MECEFIDFGGFEGVGGVLVDWVGMGLGFVRGGGRG